MLTADTFLDEIQRLEGQLAHERAKLAETTGLLAQARAKWERSLELRRGTVEALRSARRERDAIARLFREPDVFWRLLEAAHAWRLAARVGRPGGPEADALYEAIVAWEATE